MAVKLQFRRDTAANWESNNTILSEGEFGLDTTNQRFKIGDGVNGWNDIDNAQYTNKAETFTATTTILGFNSGTTEWTEETTGDWDGFFTVTKTISGILTSDTPIVDLDLSGATGATVSSIELDFQSFVRVEIVSNNNVQFYASSQPANNLTLIFKVVR